MFDIAKEGDLKKLQDRIDSGIWPHIEKLLKRVTALEEAVDALHIKPPGTHKPTK